MATPTLIDQTDPPLVQRAQRYEREALRELFDRTVGSLYAVCSALTSRAGEAEALARQVLLRALAGLPDFAGDARGFEIWLLRLAAHSASRPRPAENGAHGMRQTFRELPQAERETLALRLLGGWETGRVAYTTRRTDQEVRTSLVTSLRQLAGVPNGPVPGDLRRFDGALDRVLGGDSPEVARTGVHDPADAHLLVAAAASLAALGRTPPPPETLMRLRTAFFADAAERRALWVHRHRNPAMVPGVEVRRGPSRFSTGAALMISLLVFVGAGASLALFSMFASPDSPFYPVKQTAESVLLAMPRSPEAKADLELKLATTREREAEDMAVAGKGDLAAQAMDAHFNLLRASARDLGLAPTHDAQWREERDQYNQAASESTEELQNSLSANHQGKAATQVKSQTQQFQRDRKTLDQGLGSGSTPQPGPSANTGS